QREQALREAVTSQMSAAVLSAIRIENVIDPVKPLIQAYHVRVPGYAHRTGKRLFLQPAFFQHNHSSDFATSERRYPIYFHYPWSEDDTVNIEIPAGFALDNAEMPAPLNIGDVGKYDVNAGITKDGRTLQYHRTLSFGFSGALLFPPSSYGQIKQAFDTILQRDSHTIVLKQSVPAAK